MDMDNVGRNRYTVTHHRQGVEMKINSDQINRQEQPGTEKTGTDMKTAIQNLSKEKQEVLNHLKPSSQTFSTEIKGPDVPLGPNDKINQLKGEPDKSQSKKEKQKEIMSEDSWIFVSDEEIPEDMKNVMNNKDWEIIGPKDVPEHTKVEADWLKIDLPFDDLIKKALPKDAPHGLLQAAVQLKEDHKGEFDTHTVKKMIRDPRSATMCHDTARGVRELLGKQKETVQSSNADYVTADENLMKKEDKQRLDQERKKASPDKEFLFKVRMAPEQIKRRQDMRSDALNGAINALKAGPCVVTVGVRGCMGDGHSFTLVNTGKKVQTIEAWAVDSSSKWKPEASIQGGKEGIMMKALRTYFWQGNAAKGISTQDAIKALENMKSNEHGAITTGMKTLTSCPMAGFESEYVDKTHPEKEMQVTCTYRDLNYVDQIKAKLDTKIGKISQINENYQNELRMLSKTEPTTLKEKDPKGLTVSCAANTIVHAAKNQQINYNLPEKGHIAITCTLIGGDTIGLHVDPVKTNPTEALNKMATHIAKQGVVLTSIEIHGDLNAWDGDLNKKGVEKDRETIGEMMTKGNEDGAKAELNNKLGNTEFAMFKYIQDVPPEIKLKQQ